MPPILFGGHHDASLRRAATLGDGWIAGPVSSFEELGDLIARLRRFVDEAGRSWDGFEIHAPTPPGALDLDAHRRLEALGVTDAMVLPINAGGELSIDEPTRQRLRGQAVAVAGDPDALYDTGPPVQKIDAVRRFAERIIGAW